MAVIQVYYAQVQNMADKLLGILDSGCQQTVMGIATLRKWLAAFRKAGLVSTTWKPAHYKDDTVFKFGGGGRLKALYRVNLPIFPGGRFATIKVSVVAGETPLLLSRQVHRDLGLVVDHDLRRYSARKLGLADQPLLEYAKHDVLRLGPEGEEIEFDATADGGGNSDHRGKTIYLVDPETDEENGDQE